ncbi:hypothetical protein IMZ48_09645 [Candidatus Bathyarchaeota archaeon]|nr:hypothetical protein [Candidatus Bathyarchaeota archaeon]
MRRSPVPRHHDIFSQPVDIMLLTNTLFTLLTLLVTGASAQRGRWPPR